MKELETRVCACGCGETITRRYFTKKFPKSYVQGHQFRGELNTNWKGGRRKASGYIFLLMPYHPNAKKNGYVRESVYVMSEHLGRPIAPNELVHHIDGIKDNNHIDNLVCISRPDHISLHHKGLYKPNSLKNLKIGQERKGYKHSEETKRKMSASHKKNKTG